ncbi:unnamed protein product, partial [marine sediment metagenome]
ADNQDFRWFQALLPNVANTGTGIQSDKLDIDFFGVDSQIFH